MAGPTKILLALLALVLIVFGVEVYLYSRAINNTEKSVNSQNKPPSRFSSGFNASPSSQLMVNFSRKEVLNLASAPGVSAIKAGDLGKPTAALVLGGFLKSVADGKIILLKGSEEVSINLEKETIIFLKDKNDQPAVAVLTTKTVPTAAELNKILKTNDLILASEVKEDKGIFESPNIIVFR